MNRPAAMSASSMSAARPVQAAPAAPVAPAAEPSFDDQMLKFLDLSQDILSLVHHENAILLETGELSFEAYVMRKVNLMTSFEKEARKLLSMTSGTQTEPTTGSMNAQTMLIDEIRRVRDALKVNSGYQIDTIRARMQEKLAAPAETVMRPNVQEGTACH